MANLTEVVTSWILILVPQPCFDTLFVEFDFLNVPCLKVVLSKGLGFGIILGSVMVKLPQIIKIMRAQSAAGINIVGVTLELCAVMASLAYGYGNGFPFSSYGESFFIFLQTWAIAFLVLHYTGNAKGAILYSAVFATLLGVLMSEGCPKSVLTFLQGSVMPVIVSGRLLQAYENFKNGSTGQLSAVTVFLLFGGSLARIFTSAQETGDTLMILTFCCASFCNAVLTFQLIYYWNVTHKPVKAGTKKTN